MEYYLANVHYQDWELYLEKAFCFLLIEVFPRCTAQNGVHVTCTAWSPLDFVRMLNQVAVQFARLTY